MAACYLVQSILFTDKDGFHYSNLKFQMFESFPMNRCSLWVTLSPWKTYAHLCIVFTREAMSVLIWPQTEHPARL